MKKKSILFILMALCVSVGLTAASAKRVKYTETQCAFVMGTTPSNPQYLCHDRTCNSATGVCGEWGAWYAGDGAD